MNNKEKVIKINSQLSDIYPIAECSLEYGSAFQLLISTRLSAQCTDVRVNIVTPKLFEKYPTSKKMAQADLTDIEQLIKTCGLYKTKAKDLIAIAKELEGTYNSQVPDSIDELTKLSGVGRKTANLICAEVYGKPGIICDTHFIRLNNLIGFVNTKNPLAVEKVMAKILPPEISTDYCHRCVLHGRAVCKARNPSCNACIIKSLCDYGKKLNL